MRFGKVSENVLEDPELDGNAVAVYAAVALHAGPDGKAWPSLTTIARLSRTSRTTAIDRLALLEKRGHVVTTHRTEPGSGEPASNLYFLPALVVEGSAQDAPRSAQDAPQVVRAAHQGSARGVPEQTNEHTTGNKKRATAAKDAACLHMAEDLAATRGDGRGHVTIYTAGFESWWQAYPRHREKRGAYTKWSATLSRGAQAAELLLAARAYAAECETEGRAERYIKLPATFLGPAEPWRDYLNGHELNGHDGNGHERTREQVAASLFGRGA